MNGSELADVRRFLAVRVACWITVALSLVWAPLPGEDVAPFRAYDGLTDLLFGSHVQWDAVWFIHLAEHGYDSTQITAFFPGYPLLVAGLAEVTRSTIVAGVIVSLLAGCAAVVILRRLAATRLGERAQRDAVLLMALYPLAYVFTSVYSESLYLALAAGSFYAGLRRRPVVAGALAALAVDTRVLGLALVPALAVLLWPRTRSARELGGVAAAVAPPLAALGGYALYLHHRFGDAFAFVHAAGTDTWNRHVPTLGPISGLWQTTTAAWHGALELLRHLPRSGDYPEGLPAHDMWSAWNIAHFCLVALALWLTWVAWQRLGPAFGVYSLAVIAIVLSSPADFVPLASSPRYLLADFPLFLAAADLLQSRPRLRQVTLTSFAAVGLLAAVAFSRKTWVA
ncbi:MAG: mannosyltransferase family protein [Gaiellales bacterium]